MKTSIKYISALLIAILFVVSSCSEESYSLGELTAPNNVVINAEIVGQDATHPNGDGSGEVNFSITGDNVLSYKIDFGTDAQESFTVLTKPTASKKYTLQGVHNYVVTVVSYGTGGVSTVTTTEIQVRSDFNVNPKIVTDLTNDGSKTWSVNPSVPGHFGVGPWADPTTVAGSTPSWWSAGIDEKVASANCFYTATYTFTKLSNGTYTLKVETPDGVFAKGEYTNLPITGTAEECYPFTGDTRPIAFAAASSGIENSTKTNINVAGNDGFIGYGSCTNTYEILSISGDSMYLRSQGVESGNAWYLILKPVN